MTSQKRPGKRAAVLLNARGNRFSLVMAALCGILVSVIVFYVTEGALPMIFDALSGYIEIPLGISDVLFFLLFLVFAMPLWLGMLRMASMMAEGERPLWHEVFHYTTGTRLWRRALNMALPIMLSWLPLILCVVIGAYSESELMVGMLGMLALPAAAFGFILMSGMAGVTTLMVGNDQMKRRDAKRMAARLLSGRRMRLLGRSVLQCFYHVLCIVCTVGLVFLLHSLPMAMLTNACRVSDEKTM